jgi:hypothetical protein
MSFPRSILLLAIVVVCTCFFGCAEEPTDRQGQEVSLAITSPTEGSIVDEARFRVRGTAEGAREVDVNGQSTGVFNDEWDVLIDFEEGPATVTAEAGGEVATVDFYVDTTAPVIDLVSPERGLFIDEADSPEVTFAGQVVEEGSGIKALSLDGAAVDFDDDGQFSHTVTLEAGYNEFELRAVDEAGNVTVARRAALYGPTVDPASEIDSAAEVFIKPSTLEVAAEAIEAILTPERLTAFASEAMADNETIDIDTLTYDSLSVTITPNSAQPGDERGYLEVVIHVVGLEMDGTATFSSSDYDVTIGIDEVTVTTQITLSATDAGGLEIGIQGSELELDEEDLHFVAGDFSDEDSDTLRGLAATVVELAFSELLGDQVFDELFDPDVLRRQVELLGRTLEFQLFIRQVRVTGAGVYLNMGLAIDSPPYDGLPQVPGALNLPLGTPDAVDLDRDVQATTHRHALNRVLHGVWRAGLLHLRLEGDDFEGFDLPFDLDAGALALLFDERIRDLAGRDTPAGLKLQPLLPPVSSLATSKAAEDGQSIDLRVGELLVDLQLLPAGGSPIDLVTLALFIDLTAEFKAEDGQISVVLEANSRADVAEEHDIDFDDTELERLFENLFDTAVLMIGQEMDLSAQAELEWFTLEDIEATVHGHEGDQLSVGADVVANPDALQ